MTALTMFALAAFTCATFLVSLPTLTHAALVPGFRPPSIPLIVLSPTVSIWLNNDKLTDSWPQHWAGSTVAIAGLISIDGKPRRFLGVAPQTVPALPQVNLIVAPTQTVAVFRGDGIEFNVTFSQSAFPDNLALYARPLAYITVSIASLDGAAHSVQVYLDHTAEALINKADMTVTWQDESAFFANTSTPAARALSMNTYTNLPFSNRGDGVKNEWGRLYLAVNSKRIKVGVQADVDLARAAFVNSSMAHRSVSSRAASSSFASPSYASFPSQDDRKPRHANDAWPGSIFVLDFGVVTAPVSDYFIWAFDEQESMWYFGDSQKPYWSHLFSNSVPSLLSQAFSDYSMIMALCSQRDERQIAALTASGGDQYATITSLVHRQATGATILTWNSQRSQPWAYMKEISSDGDISTVDVIYPASPFFVLYGAELLRLTLLPVLAYGANETTNPYRLPWAPHHLGAWPVADILSEEQEQMPVEESGNMLIMLAAIAQQQNNQVDWLKPYWAELEIWANYLNGTLPDPGNQLCTDDFEGPSPHNINLSLKGILGLASYSMLLAYKGDKVNADLFMRRAQALVQQWLQNGLDDSGDHFKLQFDLKGTWSSKYNLAWQKVLGIKDQDLFPASVAANETAWYLSHARQYGVPLDSRGPLLKCDWLSWCATFAPQPAQARAMFAYLYNFANTSPSRVPFTDWYDSSTNKQIGFQARPVMGGLYAKVLLDSVVAKRSQDAQVAEEKASFVQKLRLRHLQ